MAGVSNTYISHYVIVTVPVHQSSLPLNDLKSRYCRIRQVYYDQQSFYDICHLTQPTFHNSVKSINAVLASEVKM